MLINFLVTHKLTLPAAFDGCNHSNCFHRITSPLILIVVGGVFYGSLRIRQLPSPVQLFGRDWTVNQLCIALHVAAIPVLYFIGAQSIMFWVIGNMLQTSESIEQSIYM